MKILSIYISLCVLAPCLLGTCRSVRASTAFSDNFEDPAYTAANWTIESGAWRVKGGVYDEDGTRTAYNFSMVSSQTNFTNFTLDCDLTHLGVDGLAFREDLVMARSIVLIASTTTGRLYFTTNKGNGLSDILATAPLNAAYGSNLHLTLTAQGNSFTAVATGLNDPSTILGSVSLSGSQITQNLTGGRVGVYEADSPSFGEFDNFAVAVPEPGTWAACVAGAGLIGYLRWRKPEVA